MSEQKYKRTNLRTVKLDNATVVGLGRVTTGKIFDTTNAFHSEGLFSVEVFGPVGSETRNRKFGRIDLNIEVIHPLIYQTILSLKSFYGQIMDGTALAIWNPKTREFEKSIDPKAGTGFNFFMKHIKELKFEETESEHREFKIKLFNKTIKDGTATMKHQLVMPAGLRDYTVDKNGKPQEDEVNGYYRKILAQANLIDPNISSRNPDLYDSAAIGIQKAISSLYDYIMTLLDGKNKLVLDKWVSRKTFNSTRNVITSYIDKSTGLHDKRRLGYNDCLVGIHQFARASAPKSLYEIKSKYIRDIFPDNSTSAYLTNVKTLKREEVLNTHVQKDYDLWTSSDGLEKVISMLGSLDVRSEPILVNKGKHYLGLIYRDSKCFKFFQDIDELPEFLDKTKVRPVTLSEFIYMSIYHMDGQYPGLATRYPITGYGSIYPVMVKLTTTNDTDILYELNHEWQETENIAYGFPILTSGYFNTMVVHHSHLGALGGDFDGDVLSLTMTLSDESKDEITKFLKKKEYYVNDRGELVFSNATDVLNGIFNYIT